jgi:hypothetical protein
MNPNRSRRLLLHLTIAGSGLFLLGSLIHGPGRGLSLARAGEAGLGLLVTITYTLIFCGALTLARSPRAGAIILLTGLIARCFLESRLSLAQEWWHSAKSASWTGAIAIAYLLNFIAPALLMVDSRHLLWRRRTRPIPD